MTIMGPLNASNFVAKAEMPMTEPPTNKASQGNQQQLVAKRKAKALPRRESVIFIFFMRRRVVLVDSRMLI